MQLRRARYIGVCLLNVSRGQSSSESMPRNHTFQPSRAAILMYLLSDGSLVILPAFASHSIRLPVRTATTPSSTISDSGTEYSKLDPGMGPVFAIASSHSF